MMKSVQNRVWPGQDNRRYSRIPARFILSCSKFTGRDFSGGAPRGFIETVMKNISCGGVLFESRVKFPVGTLLKIDLSLPGWESFKTEFLKPDRAPVPAPLTVLAHVARLDVLTEDGRYDIGVCFSAIDQSDQKALRDYIDAKNAAAQRKIVI